MQVLAVILTAAMASSAVASQGDGAPWPDVPPSHWACKAVSQVDRLGLIEGLPDGTFGAARAMTRYEFGVIAPDERPLSRCEFAVAVARLIR